MFALAMTWGLVSYGAAGPHRYSFLFLMLLVAGAAAVWGSCRSVAARPHLVVILAVGSFLLANVALRGPVTRAGYVVLSIGWLALLITVLLVRQRVGNARLLVVFLVTVGGFEAFYGLVQSMGGVEPLGTDASGLGLVASGTFGNRNHLPGLLNMVIPLAIAALLPRFSSQSRRSEAYAWAWLVILACAFMGLAVVLSLSRAGILTLALTIAAIAFLLGLKRRRARLSIGAGAGSLLLATILVLAAWVGLDAAVARFRAVDISTESRLRVYQNSLELIRDHPLGVGPGMYRWHFARYDTKDDGCAYTHAHNDYIETAVDWGLPVAAAFWGLVLWVFQRNVRGFLDSDDPWRQGLALGGAGAVFSILLHSFVDFNLQIPANWAVFCIILGVGLSGADASRTARSLGRPAGIVVSGIAALALTALFMAAGLPVFRDTVAIGIATAGTSAALEKSLEWAPDHPMHHFALGLNYRDSLEEQDLEAARRHLETAVRINPFEGAFRQELAGCYEFLGNVTRAEEELTAAVRLWPDNADARWRLGNFYLRQGRSAEGCKQFKRVLELDPGKRQAALAVLWKADLGFADTWPADRDSRLMLLQFLVQKGAAFDRIRQVRRRIPDLRTDEAAFYLRRLDGEKRYDELREEWVAFNRAEGLSDPAFEVGTNLLWDGRFRLPPGGGIFDWRIPRSAAYTADREESLRIEFNGTENVAFAASQTTVLRPGHYVFSARVKADGLTTEEGLYFRVGNMTTSKLVGTTPWTDCRGEIRVAEQGPVRVELRRDRSRRIDNKLRGAFRVAWVRISPERGPEEATGRAETLEW